MSKKTNATFVPPDSSAPVLDRIIEAYGFTSKKMFADHFQMAPSSLSGRYRRPYFPSDMIIQCMAETGVSLHWLLSGQGTPQEHETTAHNNKTLTLPLYQLINEKLIPADNVLFDKALLPHVSAELICVQSQTHHYIFDTIFNNITDGTWLIDIDGNINIRSLTRLPNQRVRIEGGPSTFDCELGKIEVVGNLIKLLADW